MKKIIVVENGIMKDKFLCKNCKKIFDENYSKTSSYCSACHSEICRNNHEKKRTK